MQKKVIVCSKGLKGAPSNTLKKILFMQNVFNFFSTFIKMHFIPTQNLFLQKYVGNKKKEIIDRKVFKLKRFSKVFHYFGGSLIKKLLKPWMSSFEFKLVKFLVFEKYHVKWARTVFFFFNYWSGAQLYLWIWSLFYCTLYIKVVLLILLREP